MRYLLVILLLTGALGAEPPLAWEFVSTTPGAYRLELDSGVAHSGQHSARLASTEDPAASDYGLLLQRISAVAYRGRRLRMEGFLRTEAVKGWCGMWLRLDGPEGPLVFDNMQDRPIRGTTPWTRYAIEVEVPAEAREIHFGALLTGGGLLWLDSLEFKTLGPAIPGKSLLRKIRGLPSKPQNLEFEKEKHDE